MEYLEKLIPYLWNVYSQTLLVVIALGYVIRVTPIIANKWIPPIGIVTGTVFFALTSATLEQPIVSRVGVGLVLSVLAWMGHLLVISRIEDWLASKIPAVDRIMKATADKAPLLVLGALLAVSLLATGCASTPYRAAYNTLDSLDSAVSHAQKVWANYRALDAKAQLQAEGIATPTKEQVAARMMMHPDTAKLLDLDEKYRKASAALIAAASTAQALEDAGGGKAALDPAWQTKAVDAANAIIRAVMEITHKQLKEVTL